MDTPFKLTTSPGASTVEVDGRDITNKVSRVVFEVEAGVLPRLGLELRTGAGVIEGSAVVTVYSPAVLDFFESVDPDALNEEVLKRMTSGMFSGSPAPVVALEVLQEWARDAFD